MRKLLLFCVLTILLLEVDGFLIPGKENFFLSRTKPNKYTCIICKILCRRSGSCEMCRAVCDEKEKVGERKRNETENMKGEETSHRCDRTCIAGKTMTCHYDWNIQWTRTLAYGPCGNCTTKASDCYNKGCFPADGFSKPIIQVNDQLPWPVISVCENDTIVVNVHNNLQNGGAMTVHWHGLDMRDSQWMDGVPMVSQCPLSAAESLQYKFTAFPHGTHWWHSHNSLQRGDELVGPLIVRQPKQDNVHSDLYDIDINMHVVMVSDWFHTTVLDKYTSFYIGKNPDGLKAENIVINEKGRTPNSTTIPYELFLLTPNKRTRFRAISHATLYCALEITIDDHELMVISTDGNDIQPEIVSTITIQPGERYDFVVNANKSPSNYWMRITGNSYTECKKLSQKAIVRYEDPSVSNTTLPTTNKTKEFRNLNPMLKDKNVVNPVYVNQLKSVSNISEKLRGNPDKTLFFELSFDSGPVINNIVYKPADRPLLFQYDTVDKNTICNAPNFTVTKVPKQCVHVVKVKSNQLIEMVIFDKGKNKDSGHPIHLHGQPYAVVAMKRANESEPLTMEKMKDIFYKTKIDKQLVNPPMKDTVIIPNRGYTIVRFFSDNPGFWPLHCHILYHDLTMFLLIQVGEPEIFKEKVPKNFNRCGSYEPTEN